MQTDKREDNDGKKDNRSLWQKIAPTFLGGTWREGETDKRTFLEYFPYSPFHKTKAETVSKENDSLYKPEAETISKSNDSISKPPIEDILDHNQMWTEQNDSPPQEEIEEEVKGDENAPTTKKSTRKKNKKNKNTGFKLVTNNSKPHSKKTDPSPDEWKQQFDEGPTIENFTKCCELDKISIGGLKDSYKSKYDKAIGAFGASFSLNGTETYVVHCHFNPQFVIQGWSLKSSEDEGGDAIIDSANLKSASSAKSVLSKIAPTMKSNAEAEREKWKDK